MTQSKNCPLCKAELGNVAIAGEHVLLCSKCLNIFKPDFKFTVYKDAPVALEVPPRYKKPDKMSRQPQD